MKRFVRIGIAAALVFGSAGVSAAQTADEVVERHLTALGGRAALEKLTSRVMTGTIVLTIDAAGDISGPLEVTSAAPNKARTLLTLDLSAFGAGKMTYDERFDGSSGYLIDTLQGNRDVTGNQLDNLRNETFPSPLLDYKRQGATIALAGKEKVNDRDAYVLVFTPKAGPPSKRFIDAESLLEIRTIQTTDNPTLGTFDITLDYSDFRDVDGVKVAFQMRATSSAQNFKVTLTNVTHNQPIDAALFLKPVQ